MGLTTRTGIVCAIILGALTQRGLAAEDEIPRQLRGFVPLLSEETKALDTLRHFHLVQGDMLEWDLDQARTLAEREDIAAEAKVNDARERVEVLRKAYEMFLEHYPSNARALTYYGELLYDRFDEMPRAIQNWKLATSLDPELAIAWNNLGIHYCHAGDYHMGFNALEKALEIEPDNPDFLFNMTQAYLVHSQHATLRYGWDKKKLYKEAMKLSKQAMQEDPGDFTLAQDYAVNFFAAENFGLEPDWRKAAQAWDRARELARTEDERFYAWLNAARAYQEAGQTAKAHACAVDALRLKPESEAARRIAGQTEKPAP